jgi:hypothetical protein
MGFALNNSLLTACYPITRGRYRVAAAHIAIIQGPAHQAKSITTKRTDPMFNKRKFIAVTTALTLTAIAGLSPALAAGGNDPIKGIDIIIKKDPGSQPIKPFSLGGSELEKLNAFQGTDRPRFVLKTIGTRLDAGKGFVTSGMTALGKIWCAPCKMADSFQVKFPHDDATYTISITMRSGEATRPTQVQGNAKVLPNLDAPNPKAKPTPKN